MLINWDVSTGQPIRKIRAHGHRINCVKLAADASIAISGSYDATVKVWDLRSARFLSNFLVTIVFFLIDFESICQLSGNINCACLPNNALCLQS